MNRTPKRNDAQVIGDVGETVVQLLFKRFGWTADIIQSDYGEDLDCNIFIKSQRTNLHFRCQVKSLGKNSSYIKELKSNEYSIPIETTILQTWITCMFPVFLIIYNEETDEMFWGMPVKQFMESPTKLNQKKVSIRVNKEKGLNKDSRDEITKEVQSFYNKLLRLDNAKIECQVIPVIMPKYRGLSPFTIHKVLNDNLSDNLRINYHMLDSEMLPSWTTVLQRLEAQSYIPCLTINFDAANLEQYMNLLHEWLKNFKLGVSEHEWISFIITPIKIVSNDATVSSWINELTYWTSFSLINKRLVSDHEYTFEIEDNLISQVARRARSWEYYHKVDKQNDIAIDFFGTLNVSPTVKNLNMVHSRNVKWQYLLWECMQDEIERIKEIIFELSDSFDKHLTIRMLEEKKDGSIIIAITNSIFDPFLGLYSAPRDWKDYDNNIISRLEENGKLELMPGKIYEGEVPEYFDSVIRKFERAEMEHTIIREFDSVPGFPIRHDDRLIQIIRLQMLDKTTFKEVEASFLRVSKNMEYSKTLHFCEFTFTLIDDTWWTPIFELSISWRPKVNQSSISSLKLNKEQVLEIFDSVMPTIENHKIKREDIHLKNTLEILSGPGEIYFEKYKV